MVEVDNGHAPVATAEVRHVTAGQRGQGGVAGHASRGEGERERDGHLRHLDLRRGMRHTIYARIFILKVLTKPFENENKHDCKATEKRGEIGDFCHDG